MILISFTLFITFIPYFLFQGVDVFNAGLATHYIPSAKLSKVEAALASLGSNVGNETSVRSLLNDFQGKEPMPEGILPRLMPKINSIFNSKPNVEAIYEACRKGGDFGKETIYLMAR